MQWLQMHSWLGLFLGFIIFCNFFTDSVQSFPCLMFCNYSYCYGWVDEKAMALEAMMYGSGIASPRLAMATTSHKLLLVSLIQEELKGFSMWPNFKDI